MRDWLHANYFHETTGIAASFQGEVPQAFHTIRAVFGPSPAAAGAFLPGEGVADYPPEPEPEAHEDREVSREEVLRYLGRTSEGYQAQMTGLNTLNRKEL